jgi:thiamine biosynthesis lipoprotein ApbE
MVFQTPIAFTIAGPDAKALDDAMSAAFSGVGDGERASSVYRTDSDLSRLNRAWFHRGAASAS